MIASASGSTVDGSPLRHAGTVAGPIATASPSPLGPPMLQKREALHAPGPSSPARVFAPAGASKVSQKAACGRPHPGGPGGYVGALPPVFDGADPPLPPVDTVPPVVTGVPPAALVPPVPLPEVPPVP